MDRPTINDREFGKGRQYDSSSSRESSPRRPSKRSFSPADDEDDNLEATAVEHDDTPPPPDRSLLRQPLAFQSVLGGNSLAITTYEAEPIPKKVGRPKKNPFMRIDDGNQEAPVYARKQGRSTKKRRTEEYSSQTTRFRLPQPTKLGKNVTAVPGYNPTIAAPSTASTPDCHHSAFYVTMSPTPTLSSSYPSSSTVSSSLSPTPIPTLPRALQVPIPPNPALQKGKQREFLLSQPVSVAQPQPQHNPHPSPSITNPAPQSSPDLSPTLVQRQSPQNYYRRDYEKEREISRMAAATSSSRKRDSFKEQSIRNSGKPVSNHARPGRTEKPQSQNSQLPPRRMVTLLIQDRRYGRVDDQLTEVRLPLRPLDDPKEGFWADAQLLSEQLQAGPARIDGPARVYTFRGKYRQFFLRVSPENEDEFTTMNLIVAPNRTIECFVEELPVAGTAPVASYKPPHVRQGSSSDSCSSSPEPSPAPTRRPPYKEERARGIQYGRVPVSELASIHGPPPGVTLEPQDGPELGTAASPYSAPGSGTPSDDEDKSENEHTEDYVAKQVDAYIREDPDMIHFFQAKANKQPHRVCDTLTQYRFVKKWWDKLVGTNLPSVSRVVEKEHILQALLIEDPEFQRICTETMALLELYGPGGKRRADETVLKMMEDKTEPAYGSKPIKKLLHWMQDLDKKWREEHRNV